MNIIGILHLFLAGGYIVELKNKIIYSYNVEINYTKNKRF
jgi:hypothetical protein